jgi:hypothetical protein
METIPLETAGYLVVVRSLFPRQYCDGVAAMRCNLYYNARAGEMLHPFQHT